MDLTTCIDRFRGPLVGLIASWGASHVDALELAQESFADAYLNRESCREDFNDPDVFARWLRGVARNKFRNFRRAKIRRKQHIASLDPVELAKSATVPEPAIDPRIVQLREAIGKLPTKLRQVIMMHYLEETTVKEVAALLSVTPKTVEGRLYQARKQLRQRMDGANHPTVISKAQLL
ncbi:MAG: RNA polymerase sigma factor [Planctomycetales bacterium]|nr:RNA polymerase sigma factor [Planctomycetales bacterium]